MKKIKHLLWRNKKTCVAVVLLVGLYFVKKIPGLEAERELLEQLWALIVLGSVALVPSFRIRQRESDTKPEEPQIGPPP